jgi:5'-methylthioadenosine phosphorylase
MSQSGTEQRVGIVGGSGLYEMEGLQVEQQVDVDTPFGEPSDSYTLCSIEGREAVFLPRHGRGHRLLPGEVNYRANIYGFKKLGVHQVIAVSAVGSLEEDIHPRDVVVPDQFIDRTKGRADTFFGDGAVAHISFAEPICPELAGLLAEKASGEAEVHRGGTYLCMEGPAFSTKAESHMYRSWGASIIGMTNLQEAKLAREAEMCYATLAMVTDYDCWHESEEDVSVEVLLDNLKKNAATSQAVLRKAVPAVPEERACECGSALENAILTPAEHIPENTKEKLDIIAGKYLE